MTRGQKISRALLLWMRCYQRDRRREMRMEAR